MEMILAAYCPAANSVRPSSVALGLTPVA